MTKRRHPGLLFLLLAVALWLVGGRLSNHTAGAAAPTPDETVRQAWELARQSGRYHYRSTAEQITYPAPAVTNAGRPPRQDRLALEGSIDVAAESLEMTIWEDGSFDPQRGLSLRLADGEAYGRRGQGDWQLLEEPGAAGVADVFAPGGDPLGFLGGAVNIQAAGSEQHTINGLTLTYSRYTFDVSGPAFARYMLAQIEAHQEKYGPIPPGVKLAPPELYQRMTGSGELWLNANGLPARLTVHLDIPDQPKAGERLAADLTNDYFDFDLAQLEQARQSLWANPAGWLSYQLPRLQSGMAATLPAVQILAAFSLLLAFSLRYWRTRPFYVAVVLFVIVAMLFSPLLQGHHVLAYQERINAQQAAQTEQLEKAETQQEVAAALEAEQTNWNPHQNPLAANHQPPISNLQSSLSSALSPQSSVLSSQSSLLTPPSSPLAQLASTDSDGDGVTDADEAFWGTCAYPVGSPDYISSADCIGVPDPSDSDGDGLSDDAEINYLNTYPTSVDTDGDSITDTLEVQGFTYQGQTWYLDPNNEDSNGDGIPDGGECSLFSGEANYNLATACTDRDGDGIPDFSDPDNDGDGVTDEFDKSPNYVSPLVYDNDNPLLLTINNLTLNKPVLVDIQLRPTNSDHLNYHNHVLDWPLDDEGQIQRHLNTTWATTSNTEYRSDAANAANGDIRLVPMLEIIMPYSSNHYANLPVKAAYNGTNRVLGTPVDEWLDSEVTAPYSMSIDDMNLATGELVAYLPLSLVTDDYDTPVAYTTRIIYQPSQASWGAAHQYRVVWLVQMLTDECIAWSDAAKTNCSQYQDKVTIIHNYHESWQLTGMNVSEEHGTDVAILYENPAEDDELDFDSQLWYASWNLGNTFLRGRDIDGNGQRDVRVDNLASQLAAWNLDYTDVASFSYPHQGHLAKVMMTETVSLLNTHFTPYASQTVPTLLVAQEHDSRTVNLDIYTGSADGGLVLDMAPATNPIQVLASLSWSSYEYVNGTWANYEPAEYLEYLGEALPIQTFFQAAGSSQEAQDEAEGKALWAQLYYATLYQGAMSIVQAGSNVLWEPSVKLPETSFEPLVPVNTNWGISTIAYEFAIVYASTRIAAGAAQQGIWSSFTYWLKGQVTSTASTPQFTGVNRGGLSSNPLALRVLLLAAVAMTFLAIGLITGNETYTRVGVILMSIVTIIVVTFYIINAIQKIVAAVQAAVTIGQAITSGLAAGRFFQGVGVIGFIIGAIITWGAVGYMIVSKGLTGVALGVALSMAIAATIVLFIYLILDFLGLGIIVLLITLLDAVFAIFGAKGPTQLLTEAIADTLYEVRFLIKNLSDSNRLAIGLPGFAFADEELGFTSQNSLIFTTTVTNTVRIHKNFSFNTLDARAVFRYFVQSNDAPQHAGLVSGEMEGEWINLGNRTARANQTMSITIPLSSVGTGIGQSLDGHFYIIEAYIAPYQGCWQFMNIDTDCKWYEFRGSSPINMGQELVYDVLPSTLQSFVQMNWDARLPDQADLDNDGLLSVSAGGADPGHNADSDGDGLSDYYEIVYGLNALDADPDGDGLNDAEELAAGTNPFAADSDGDGLNDYLETRTGWLVVYKNYGQSYLTRVWSDPNNSDADQDTLSDLEEFLFGFHPQVASDPSAVLDLVKFNNLSVNEESGLQLLARFEESAGATLFADSSGLNNHLTCDPSTESCPTPGQSGRYQNALAFDGINDYLTFPPLVNPGSEPFTAAAWFNASTISNSPVIWQQTDSGGFGRVWLSINSNGVLASFLGNSSLISTNPVSLNTWQHAAVTYDGTTLRLYLNGNLEAESVRTLEASEGDFWLGRHKIQTTRYFSGALDEIVLLNKALSAAEINDLADGRYNPNDLVVPAGVELAYRATVTNTSSTTAAGFLSANSRTIQPSLAEPVIALSFEPAQQIAYFTNSLGEENSVTCLGDGTCPTAGIDGAINNGVEFDGIDDYLTLPTLNVFEAGFNLSFWLQVDSLPASGQQAMILDTESTDIGAMDIYINSSGKIVFDIVGDWANPYVSNHTFSLGSWTHVSFNEGNIFINGNIDYDSVGYPDVRIGNGRLGNSLDGTQPFDGRLDELVYYDRNIDDGTNGGLSFNAIKDIRDGNYTSDQLPRALFRFDELTSYDGTIFYDDQPNTDHATCSGNTCPTLTAGYSGRALSFDGVDDYASQPGSFTTGEDGGITLDFYIKMSAYPTNNAYIYDTASGVDVLDMYITPAGKFVATREEGTHTSTGSIPLNQWVHITLTYVRSFDALNLWRYDSFLYFNGVYDSYWNYRLGSSPQSWDIALTIGAGRIGNSMSGNNPFNGLLDEANLGVGVYSFDPSVANMGYQNLASDLRAASCTNLFLCPTLTDNGRFGSATTFDGDDSLLINQGVNFFSTGKFTQAAWVYPTPDDDNYHAIMGYQGGPPQQRAPSLYLYQQTHLHGGFGDGTNWNNFSIGPVLTPNAWNHVATTFDGTTYRLYVNGKRVYSTTNWAGRVPYPSTKYNIGRIDNYFEGRLDEVVILPEAVTAEGIQLLMNSPYPLIDIPALFETFSAAPLTSLEVSGAAEVSPYATTSRHQIDQEVEAALMLQAQIDYPVVDDNAANLSLFLPFEETPGSTTFENLIDYYDGTIDLDATCAGSHCPTAGLRGQIGRAAYFDGIDDHFFINLFDVPSSWRPKFRTFSAWVNAKQGTLFYGYVNSTQYVHLDMNELETQRSSSNLVTPLDLPRSEWFHLAVTIDNSDVTRVYINGVEVMTGTNKLMGGDLEYFSIGANVQGQDYLEGYLDDLRLYNATLTAAQIQNLYEKSAPVFRFEFDEEGEATAFTDNSVNGYTGQPTLQTCAALSLDSLTVNNLAVSPANVYVSLDGERLLYETEQTAGASLTPNVSGILCGQQTLSVGIVANGTTTSLGTVILNVASPGTSNQTFNAGGNSVTLRRTIDATPIYQPNPIPGIDGRIDNGALFDGQGYITLTDATVPLDLVQDFTIATWVKTTATNVGLLVKSDDDSNWEAGEKAFYLDNLGQPTFVGWGNNYIRSNTAVNDDQWHFVAVVWDRDASGTSGVRKMYVDGVDVTASSNYNANNNDVAGHTLKIGGTNHSLGEAHNIFQGQLDEMVAYRRALSAAELYSIYLREVRWYRDRATSFVQVDTDAPAIQFLSNSTYWANGYIQLAVATTDPTSQVALLDFGLKAPGASSFTWHGAPQCQDNGRTGAAWCPSFTASGEGQYEVQFRAVDSVGNQTISPVYTLYVDNTPPTATGSYTGQWASLATNDDKGLAWSVNLSGSLSDPDLNSTPAVAGSGVATNTVYVTLLDAAGGVISEGAQQATATASTWGIEYKLEGARPNGLYTIQLSLEDKVGNTATVTIGTIRFDERPPQADFRYWEVNDFIISDTITLRGAVSDQADWGGELAQYHFEEETGYYDYTRNANHATCTNCPTASAGIFGQGLSFDGVNDTLNLPSLFNPISETFSIALWFRADSSGTDQRVLVQQTDGTGQGRSLLYLRGDNILATNLGGATTAGSTIVTADTWHHVALTYDGATVNLYLDGKLDGSAARTAESATGGLQLGSNRESSAFFPGLMDEVTVYDQPLTHHQIYALAQSNTAGIQSVQVGLEIFDFAAAFAEPQVTWYPATVSNGSWSYTIPAMLEGMYNLHLRTTDTNGNISEEGVIWSGLLDVQEPQIVASGQHIGGGSAAQTEYTFTFSDFLLDENSYQQPCPAGALVSLTYADDTLPHDGLPFNVTATCRLPGWEANRAFDVCDGVGHCQNVLVMPTSAPAVASVAILTPTHHSSWHTSLPLVNVGAYAPDGISNLTLSVNGVVVKSHTPPPGTADMVWATNWQPSAAGTYTITAVMTSTVLGPELNSADSLADREDAMAAVYTDTVVVTITGEPTAITLADLTIHQQAPRLFMGLFLLLGLLSLVLWRNRAIKRRT